LRAEHPGNQLEGVQSEVVRGHPQRDPQETRCNKLNATAAVDAAMKNPVGRGLRVYQFARERRLRGKPRSRCAACGVENDLSTRVQRIAT
jgi:hypothetical protein